MRRIDHGDGVVVHADASTFSAQAVIVAIPPALAGRLDYRPQRRGDRDQLTQRVAQGSVVKSLAVYPEPFWRRDGLSGQVTSAVGPVKIVFDNTPPSASPGVLVSFLEGNQARRFGVRPAAERRAAVLACLQRFFGAPAVQPSEFVDLVWADEPFSRGCYGAFLAPGAWTAHGQALRAPIGCLHWAGAETATTWSGYMDGAVSSGERAAREVVGQISQSLEAPGHPEAAKP